MPDVSICLAPNGPKNSLQASDKKIQHTLRMLYEMGPAPQIVYLMTEDGGHEMQVTALLTAGIPIQLVTKKQGCGLCGLSKTGAQYITLDFVREFLPNRKKRPLHEAIVPAPKKPFCLFCAAIEH